MNKFTSILASLMLLAGVFAAPSAQAYEITVSKSVTDGTFTLTNNSTSDDILELVVDGLGISAGTTLPGWSSAALLFSDPLNCLGPLNTTITSGFCYQLTDTTQGSAIGPGTVTTFTYDSSFDDQGTPSEFAVLVTVPGGATEACFGDTSTGCNVPALPEPPAIWTFGLALMILAAAHGVRGIAARGWNTPA